MRHGLVCMAMAASLLTSVAMGQAARSFGPDDYVYPEGKRFPLMLYSIHTPEEFAEAGEAGWNMGHRYNFDHSYIDLAGQNGWLSIAHLKGKTKVEAPVAAATAETTAAGAQAANPEEAGATGEKQTPAERAQTEEEAAADIKLMAAYDNLAWWDLPEEMRYWREDEYDMVKNLSAWTRKHDPRQRPNTMYIAGHYSAEAVEKYVEYLDIIGTGIYTEYSHQPRAWVRWRMEETIRGIELAGHEIGPDYRNGQRTPIGIPMLFCDITKMGVMIPQEAYHDFWSCIASGARGIAIFSYWHKRDVPTLQKTWELGYKRAAANLMGAGGLDQAILFGETVPLQVEVTKGPAMTPTFRPYGLEEDVSMPSVNVLAKSHEGTLYVITVCSHERPVTARISGLPAGVEQLEVLFEGRPEEKGGNTVEVTDGAFEDEYPWLTVHLYRAPMP